MEYPHAFKDNSDLRSCEFGAIYVSYKREISKLECESRRGCWTVAIGLPHPASTDNSKTMIKESHQLDLQHLPSQSSRLMVAGVDCSYGEGDRSNIGVELTIHNTRNRITNNKRRPTTKPSNRSVYSIFVSSLLDRNS